MTIRLIEMELGRFMRVARRRKKRHRLSTIIAPGNEAAECAASGARRERSMDER
jgi:hypothetical protein